MAIADHSFGVEPLGIDGAHRVCTQISSHGRPAFGNATDHGLRHAHTIAANAAAVVNVATIDTAMIVTDDVSSLIGQGLPVVAAGVGLESVLQAARCKPFAHIPQCFL